MIKAAAEVIEPDQNRVKLTDGRALSYDFLVVATGTQARTEETPGLEGPDWQKSIFDFYTIEGAVALAKHLRTWQGGRLVLNVVENPIKCPVAPLEFIMLADWFFQERDLRDRVDLIYATPLSGAFTKPIASKYLGDILADKNIDVVPDFVVEHIDPEAKKLVHYDETELEYDLLVTVPLNKGDDLVARSGLGDELNYVPVDIHTCQSTAYPNIFALGDAAALPTSKSGSAAHFAVDCFADNFLRYIDGLELLPSYDGHTNCFIESGFGKGLLIDFNYEVEPLPGRYPLPGVGPFALLQETPMNHWGKMMFRWMYWNILLKGQDLPLPARMSMSGKWRK